jgi:cation diffusion facilitator CzcD-associated flavoprotein CzcO
MATEEHLRVAILGAGFAGLGAAIRLQQEGIDDFAVFEKGREVGGTWWWNTYPGCQCDIPSHLYSFSFALNPEWTRTYPKQPELERYLRRVSEDFGVRPKIRFDCEIQSAEWDEDAGHWRLQTGRGVVTADVFVAAPGPLSEPSLPDVPGLDDFQGETFHTARWDKAADLRGKRVAVVGTGASAIQVVPEIQPLVDKLTVFQRTAPWVVPHRDRPITRAERAIYRRVPALQRAVRAGVYWMREMLVPGLVYRPQIMKGIERVARRHIASQVPDRALREKVTPDYTIGCKRILPSNKWYPALGEDNVELVTGGISELRPSGIVDAEGTLHEVDVVIFATGFYVTDIPMAHMCRGRGGQLLSEAWEGSPQAYMGTAVAGFPNLFMLVGPNTGLGHNSIVFMIEAQITYLLSALRELERSKASQIEVRREAQESYNAAIQRRMPQTIWSTGGCSSWYIDAKGKNTTIWPDFTWRFWQETRRFDAAAYTLADGTRRPAPSEELVA